MKLRLLDRLFPLIHQNHQLCCCSRVLASLFSTGTLTQSSPSSSSSLHSKLYYRIERIRDPRASIVPVLEKWVNEGNPVDKPQLQSLIRLMKNYKRFNHALEISRWMTDRRYMTLSPRDVAVRLDLIYRVYGLAHAENHFENLSNNLKNCIPYGALLGVYAQEKSIEKAEALMQKMREKGMAMSSFPYNMLISIYSQAGDLEKIELLMQEMESNGIPQDAYTMRNIMAAYIAASNISGMEKTLRQLEASQHYLDWRAYSLAATGYLKVGLIETALTMLKKMESMMLPRKKALAFNFLLTLYAQTGNKDELYRVWNAYKPTGKPADTSFFCMIASLSQLDDIEGAEKIFEEWESKCTVYDFRVLNKLLAAYCKKGLLAKAESAIEKAAEGRTPYASTWLTLSMGYFDHNQMPKAVEMLKKALSVARRGWKPNPKNLAACLDYLEKQGDVEGMEEITKLLWNVEALSRDLYHRLLRTYVAAGKSVTESLDRMKMDGFAFDEETQEEQSGESKT